MIPKQSKKVALGLRKERKGTGRMDTLGAEKEKISICQ